MKFKCFLTTLSVSLLLSSSCLAQFPGGGFPGGGFPGGGFDGFGGFGGRFPITTSPQEQSGRQPGPGGFGGGFGAGQFPGGGGFTGGMGGGFGMMGGTVRYDGSQGSDVEFTSSNLPVVIIETDGKPVTNDSKLDASMKIIDNGNGRRNKLTDRPNAYNGKIGIKLRGNSSLYFEQKRFTIETKDDDGNDLDVELLDMPADNDWVLLAPYNDISMMRDPFAFDLWNEMGHWAPHYRYCEVVMNGNYIGVYVLCEKIKRGKNRLDIAKLKPEDNSGIELTGGYIVRIDPVEGDEPYFTSDVPGLSGTGGGFGGFGGRMGGFNTVTWTYYYPKPDKITPEQQEYISNYVKNVEKVIQSDDFADPENGYAKYISVSSFVDYFIHTELSLNADGLKRSAYFYKTKQNEDGTGGKLHAGTVWDYNLAYGNWNFCNANKIDAWVYEGGETNPTPALWKRLTEDPAFMAKVKARWKELRRDVLSIENINRYIDEHASLLAEAQKRQYAKYTDLLVSQSGNRSQTGRNGGFGGFGGFGGGMTGGFGGGFGGADAIGMFAAYRVSSYEEEITTLKRWFADRIAFLDSNWGN
ncbi:MAG: CotH kinase family protein [Bacteroidaceae bacterium]|nr:CotH kinase family protein [Bacteroidaceae bacterium]